MINAKSTGTTRIPIPAGNYVARCYQMLHIGTVKESFQGEEKMLNKIRIGWELPNELRVFKEEKGEQPCVISKEFTLSLNEKANLRKLLASWRGKDFTEEEAKCFDVTKLLGATCMLNIIHKPKKSDPSVVYEEIGSVSPMPKGIKCPPQINKNMVLQYDDFDYGLYDSLPEFIKDKVKTSEEYRAMTNPEETSFTDESFDDNKVIDDLPF